MGEAVARTLLNHILRMFSALGIYADLEGTVEFYTYEAVGYMKQSDIPDYLKHVEAVDARNNEECRGSSNPITDAKANRIHHCRLRNAAKQILYPMWRPTELAAVAAGNPNRLVDDVNTIGMLMTSMTADTEAGYPGVPVEDECRDPYYISLACLGTRQRFRCGGVLDDTF
eukprot:Gb_18875 [translate_table: standard]